MQDSFDRLRDELRGAIESLHSDQRFNVIWFATGPGEAVAPQLLHATEPNKQRATDAIERIVPSGRTRPLDAVRRGLALRPDVLYLLSDGDFGPQNAAVMNLVRREAECTVHAILFAADEPGPAEPFLREIARLGGGAYKRVDAEPIGR